MALPRLDDLRAVLLDLDDTILDDRSGIRAAWTAVALLVREAHPELAVDSVLGAISQVTDWFWSDPERERRGRLDLVAARFEIVAGVLERLGRPDPPLAAAAARRYTAEREERQQLAEGALEALARLRRALPRLALVTNGAAEPQRAKIERFALAPYFDHVQVEGEFGLGKPERRVFQHVVAALGAEPAHCLMVGDNYRCDVLGALGAGLHAAWVDAEGAGRPPAPAPRPHATVRSLAELARRLGC